MYSLRTLKLIFESSIICQLLEAYGIFKLGLVSAIFLAVSCHNGSILLNFCILKNMAGVLLISLNPFITPANLLRDMIRIVVMKSHILSAVKDKTVKYLGVLVAKAL